MLMLDMTTTPLITTWTIKGQMMMAIKELAILLERQILMSVWSSR